MNLGEYIIVINLLARESNYVLKMGEYLCVLLFLCLSM